MISNITDLIKSIAFSSEGIALLLVIFIVCVLIARHLKSKLDGVIYAKWIVEHGQFELAPKEHVEGAIEMAEELGKKDLAIRTFAAIRQKYGHSGLRVGHVMWVVMLIHGDIKSSAEIPSFEPPSK